MEEQISVKSNLIRETFWRAVREINKVLSGQKTNTDVTKTAIIFMSNTAKIMGAEVHARGLDIVEKKLNLKLIEKE